MTPAFWQKQYSDRAGKLGNLLPGFSLCALIAMSAQFVSEHSGAPAMLMAILFGIAFSFLNEEENTIGDGVAFTASFVLKFGIVLLGTRISTATLAAVGWPTAVLVVCGLLATIGMGVVFGRLLGQSTRFSILTAGAVAICGASAALAISSVLPRTERSEKQLFLTILGVTALSTVAMIIYPSLLKMLGV
ncbi:MAG: putative sulfate exporter family transporter, partial [Pseudomonadota bacterium]